MKTYAKPVLVVAGVLALLISNTAPAQTPQDLIAIVNAEDEALNAHDLDLWLSYFTDDPVFEFVPSGPPLKGKDQIRAFFEATFVGFPDFGTTEGRVIAAGNIVISEHSTTGTHQGVWNGIPPTGRWSTMPHLDILEFEGDKIKRLTTYADMTGVLIQLGVIPVPEMAPLVPAYALPEPKPTGLSPWDADVQRSLRWNTHDLPAYAKGYRADALIFPAPLGTTVGRNEWIALSELIFQGFSGQRHVIRRVDMGDGLILTEYQNRARHSGPYMGIPASGNWTNMKSVSLLQYDADGLVVGGSYYYDELTIITQITTPPAPQSEEAGARLE